MRRTLAPFLLAVLLTVLVAAGCSGDDASTDAAETGETGETGEAGDAASSGDDSTSDAAADEASAEATSPAIAAEADTELASGDDTASGDRAESARSSEAAATSPPSTTTIPSQPSPQAGTLTAGDIDDNLNFGFFNAYLARTQDNFGQRIPSIDLSDRVVINVVDGDGAPLANTRLDVSADGRTVPVFTNALGTAYVFSRANGFGDQGELSITATAATSPSQSFVIDTNDLANDGSATITLRQAKAAAPTALDLALVIDTTGSMGDELNYLTTEFTSIVDQLSERYPNVDMRFALIVYRDDGDDYLTQVYDFADVDEMQNRLRQQSAGGGGDFPEAMDVALAEAIELGWRSGEVARVMVVNADAPPHDQGFSAALEAAAAAGRAGIRIYSLSASGVDDTAEYLMRVMAATTGGRHLFLTDDSGVGFGHQEPKVQCYVVTRLDHLLVRVLSSEVSGERLEPIPEHVIRTVGNYDNGYCSDDN